ncbi:MAG TPA: hypothetical protein VJB56_02125 [Candidatus Paceibacterota bacterium]
MLFPTHKKQLGAVFDIGTASVSATVFELLQGAGKPGILKTFRRFHKASLQKDALHFSKSTVSQFSAVIKDIAAFTNNRMPQLYVLGLSSIFYLGKTERFFVEHKKPVPFKQADIDEFIQSGKQNLFSELKRGDVVIFETMLMKSLLNGYPVLDPIGRISQSVELWVRLAATSAELSGKFTDIIESAQRNADIRFATFPTAAWILMKDAFPPEHNVLLVDIGGELTEVTFITNGIITEVLTLPFGVLNILLRISEAEHIDLENAYALLRSYTGGALSKEAEDHLKTVIKKEAKGWGEIFERVWQRASRDFMSNIQLYFLGGGAFVEEIKTAITPPLLHPEIAKELKVSVISPDTYKDRFTSYCCLEGPGDFGLLSLMLQLEKATMKNI